ncbi:MAG: peptide deformylase [Candidatus Sungbacteria bacterium RIFCSPLOWO2_01_FULL_60_25]|uniref:Peptide deformylase n=1 Tax=Candidatus Sungbacteria bacterium RIFCSPLOWO2_01_FULL_60_25 TaxID=1802281 RepID=A0A1G2LD40_9BACT|nr:MAG: peptide deformylase [Candidatus Sungbacteria bacterium RIFCSPLOWO2_01_FULL_60_25]
MPKRPVIHEPHRVLRAVAAEVPRTEIQSPEIRELIRDMKATLAAAPDGVGLAAPQIGVSRRIFLVSEEANAIASGAARGTDPEIPKHEWEQRVFINPVFTKRSRTKRGMPEGCLSVPGKYGSIARPDKVYLEWYDEIGAAHGRGFSKFFARVLQHEMDHLDGILIIDRAKEMRDVEA